MYPSMELPQYHVGDDAVMEEYLGKVSPWLPAWARWRLVAAVKTYLAVYIEAFSEGKRRCLVKRGSGSGQSPSKRLLCEETM